jgi:hypothetical protein
MIVGMSAGVTFSIDWRISAFLVALAVYILATKIKYKLVEESDK